METIEGLLRGLIGILFLTSVCWALSRNRQAINWRLVLTGITIQILLAFIFLKVPYADKPIEWISGFFVALLGFTDAGTEFVFGFLGAGPAFWEQVNTSISADIDGFAGFGLIFAFKILPTVIFFSALTSLLYYLGILQFIVKGFAWLLQKSMGLSGTESLSASANVFIGQTEAPLMVKPYIEGMNRSELLCLMSGGMATIAGGVFGAYVWMLGGADPVAQAQYGKHLLTASILSAPAAIVASKLLLPQTEEVVEDLKVDRDRLGDNVFDSICQGTSQGLKLAMNIGAMLLTFMAFLAMFNYLFEGFGEVVGLNSVISGMTNGQFESLSLNFIFGLIFAPIAWLIGIPLTDLLTVGQMLGMKLVANEFVAYQQLGGYLAAGVLEQKSIIITAYALCGFANFSSMGIQIGGIAVLAPGQRVELSRLALLSLFAGTVACLYTGAVAGMFLS